MPSATKRGKKVVTTPEVAPEPAVVDTAVAVATAAAAAPTTPVTPVTPSKKKTAAAKKPVKVVAVVTPEGIEGSFTPEPRRPLIAHLQIRTNEVVFHDQPLRYDPNPPPMKDPEPYDAMGSDMFTAGQEELPEEKQMTPVDITLKSATTKEDTTTSAPSSTSSSSATPASTPAPAPAKSIPCFTKYDLMVQFKGTVEQKRLPSNTEIACYWCAHTFEGAPCIIPEREVGGVYNVYGNFCSPSCGVSYLLNEAIDPHVRWERMALLHRIYDSDGSGRIFPAPPRESLSLFGGPMTIDVFRATLQEKKVRVDLHMPPMVSILGSIDTKPIDFFDTNLKQLGPNGEIRIPVRSVEEGLRLKRNKPLKDKESTLDTVMNIQIKSGRRGPLEVAGT